MTQVLGHRSHIVFFRLLRFYKTFNIVSALISGLSLSILTFVEFHPTTSAQLRTAEGLLVSSASTSVISIMLATMLLFRFEDHEKATRVDLTLAYMPLVFLDWSILSLVVGLLLWYGEKNDLWRTTIVGVHTAAMLVFALGVAVWMYRTMSRIGGLGKVEGIITKAPPPKPVGNRGTL